MFSSRKGNELLTTNVHHRRVEMLQPRTRQITTRDYEEQLRTDYSVQLDCSTPVQLGCSYSRRSSQYQNPRQRSSAEAKV